MDTAPLDEHDRVLDENVHPADWTNPVPAGRYNLVAVGGGTAGIVAGPVAAGLGAKRRRSNKRGSGATASTSAACPARCFGCPRRVSVVVGRTLRLPLDSAAPNRFSGGHGAHAATAGRDQPARRRGTLSRSGRRRLLRTSRVHRPRHAQGRRIDTAFPPSSHCHGHQSHGAGCRWSFGRRLFNERNRVVAERIAAAVDRRLCRPGRLRDGEVRRFGGEVHLVGRGQVLLPKESPDAARIVEDQFRREEFRFSWAG